MPRRGRHRTALPAKLIAVAAALLVGGTAVFLGGTAFADSAGDAIAALTDTDSGTSADDDASGDRSTGRSDEGDADGDPDDGSAGDPDDGSPDGKADDGRGDGADEDRDGNGRRDGGLSKEQAQEAGLAAENPFAGRDKIGKADADEYVDIREVDANGNRGEGGSFSGGSYSVDCGVSDHTNSDNYMAAPGKRNGAQHTHDYVGNTSTNAFSDEDSLDEAGTSCGNGDKSVFFWPVLRDLNGQGDDVGKDGGSLDGNVGAVLKPESAQLTFRGHGDKAVKPMPEHLMNIMGNAKAKSQDGKNENAKYTCTGFQDRVTDKYPICPSGSKLVRLLDYPSCWDGQNLESKDLRSHMAFPDEAGNCGDGFVPVPALRITLTYDQPAGRSFAIDSFPDQQHSPRTDHSDFENRATPTRSRAGADCINTNKVCRNLPG